MFWKTTTKIKAKSPKRQKTDTFTVPHSPFQLPFNHLKPKCFIMMFSLFPHVSSLFPHCFSKFLSCYPHFSPCYPHIPPIFPRFFPPSPGPPGPKSPPSSPSPPAPRAAAPGAAARRPHRRRSTRWRCATDASPGRRRRTEPGAERGLPSGNVKIAMENHYF